MWILIMMEHLTAAMSAPMIWARLNLVPVAVVLPTWTAMEMAPTIVWMAVPAVRKPLQEFVDVTCLMMILMAMAYQTAMMIVPMILPRWHLVLVAVVFLMLTLMVMALLTATMNAPWIPPRLDLVPVDVVCLTTTLMGMEHLTAKTVAQLILV
jgi:hypothetical protein